jgi:hypothetical protein
MICLTKLRNNYIIVHNIISQFYQNSGHYNDKAIKKYKMYNIVHNSHAYNESKSISQVKKKTQETCNT